MINGYQEAAEIDEAISSIFEKYGINKNNLRVWRAFTRTIRTTLDLIDNKIETVAADGTEFARTEKGEGVETNG